MHGCFLSLVLVAQVCVSVLWSVRYGSAVEDEQEANTCSGREYFFPCISGRCLLAACQKSLVDCSRTVISDAQRILQTIHTVHCSEIHASYGFPAVLNIELFILRKSISTTYTSDMLRIDSFTCRPFCLEISPHSHSERFHKCFVQVSYIFDQNFTENCKGFTKCETYMNPTHASFV